MCFVCWRFVIVFSIISFIRSAWADQDPCPCTGQANHQPDDLPTVPQARLALCGFKRVHLDRSSSEQVTVEIPAERFRFWDTGTKQYVVDPGKYQILIGGASDDIRLKLEFKIIGSP